MIINYHHNQEWAQDMFTKDALFVIGRFPLAVGHEQIANGAQGIYNMVTSLKHESAKVYSVNENTFISEGTVTYTIPSGRKLDPIPLVSVFELENETNLIKNYRAYLDISPLFIAVGLSVVPDDNGNPTFAPR